MIYHEPISIETTHTNKNGETEVKQFRSLNQASKFFGLSVQTLKELSLGQSPKIKDQTLQNIQVTHIPTLTKPPKPEIKPKQPKIHKDELWHCDLCGRDVKLYSKYSHVLTKSHLKIKEITAKQEPPPVGGDIST